RRRQRQRFRQRGAVPFDMRDDRGAARHFQPVSRATTPSFAMQVNDIAGFLCPTRLYLGVGAHARIGEVIRASGCKRMFVALDAALLESDFYAKVRTLLEDCAVALQCYTDIEPDPSARTVEKAFETCV